jgi:predicted O-methyltransferase YrrM
MDYKTFFDRFGGSLRRKHTGKRSYPLPATSEMPQQFIRLCPWEAEYLFTVARRARIGILETGRFNGGSLFLMGCAAPDNVPIYSIDIAPQNDDLLREKLQAFLPGRSIDLIVGDSQHGSYPHIGTIDLLFIDGDHTYEGCLNDLRNWYGNLTVGEHLVLHDAYLGQHGVQDALLDFMQQHPELDVVQSPYIGPSHWQYPAGSIAHLVRRGG